MITEKNFKNWIIFLPIMGVFCTSILLTYLLMGKILDNYDKELSLITESKKDLIKSNIKNRIDTVAVLVDEHFKDSNTDYKTTIAYAQTLLNNTLFDDKSYIFAYDFNGNTIAHGNKRLIGMNRMELSVNNRFLLKEMLNHIERDTGFFLDYKASYNPNTKQSREKLSYVKSLKNIDWIIGTGIYLDDYKNEVIAVKNQLESELQQTLNMVVYISVLVTVIGLVIMSYLSNSIYIIIKRYQDKLLKENYKLEEKVEQRVKEQNSIMKLFDNAEVVLYKWEYVSHKFKYISKNVEHIIGYKKKEFINKPFIYTKFVHKDDLKQYIKENKDAVQLGHNYFEHKPYRIVTKDGTTKWIREYKLLVKNERNRVSHVIGYITDITHFKNQEEIELQNKKTLALKELVHNLAHQWRQPLSVITTAASGMKLQNEMSLLNDELINEYTQNIIEHSNQLSKTIDIFNDFSIENDGKTLICMNQILEKISSLLEQQLQSYDIELLFTIHHKKKIHFNEQSLFQLMIHLLNNSIDACSTIEKEKKLILIDTYIKSSELVITIQDSAEGISEDIMEKIYEPYFTTKHQSVGTGLGLSITRNIIENLGGTLQISNKKFIHQEESFLGAEVHISIPVESVS